MNTLEQKENSQRLKAIISTSVLHILLFALCYFFYIKVQIPIEEIETGGVVINYGTSETGMGNDYSSMDEPAIGENISSEPIIDPNRPNSPTESNSSTDKDVLTQNNEEAPAVLDINPNTSNNTNTNSTTPAEPAKPYVDQRAIFKGKKNNGAGAGDGTGTTPGNQGATNGDPNSQSYVGGGGNGGNGVSLNLTGRRFITSPRIQDDGQTAGKVAVEITVDKNGTIVTAKAGARGTTISNASLWNKCEKAVLGAKLNAITSGPEIQAGSVIFTFILE
jgi:hypothetical protein